MACQCCNWRHVNVGMSMLQLKHDIYDCWKSHYKNSYSRFSCLGFTIAKEVLKRHTRLHHMLKWEIHHHRIAPPTAKANKWHTEIYNRTHDNMVDHSSNGSKFNHYWKRNCGILTMFMSGLHVTTCFSAGKNLFCLNSMSPAISLLLKSKTYDKAAYKFY